MKKRLSRMGINAILLGIILGAVAGFVTWLLTERPVTAILVSIAPVFILLCLVKDTILEEFPDDDDTPPSD